MLRVVGSLTGKGSRTAPSVEISKARRETDRLWMQLPTMYIHLTQDTHTGYLAGYLHFDRRGPQIRLPPAAMMMFHGMHHSNTYCGSMVLASRMQAKDVEISYMSSPTSLSLPRLPIQVSSMSRGTLILNADKADMMLAR